MADEAQNKLKEAARIKEASDAMLLEVTSARTAVEEKERTLKEFERQLNEKAEAIKKIVS